MLFRSPTTLTPTTLTPTTLTPTTLAPTTLTPTTLTPTVCAAPLLPSLITQSPINVSNCATLPTTVLDDFESMPLSGWTNGKLETTSTQYFTSFLGRYARSESAEKIYTSIPTTASMLKLEFDFYEIDSWYNELFAVVINCVTIPLGAFNAFNDEGTREGDVEDVHFKTSSLVQPFNQGFNVYPDQRHHVTIFLPSRFINGFLKVRFESSLVEVIEDRSFGIDNIWITAYQCGV